MQHNQSIRDALPGPAEQNSTRIAFFVAGFGMAAWAPLVPFAKVRTGIEKGTLDLLLLCLGAGSIIAMPIAGALTGRYGCRIVLLASSLLISLTLPLLATISAMPILFIALFLFGAGVGSADCVANIQAVIVERASGRPMMSGFHGLFSLGGIAGAAGVAALLSLDATPLMAVLCVVFVIMGAMMFAAPHLLPFGSQGDGSVFAIPRGVVLFIAILCFIVFLAEGAVLDWGAVFLTSVYGADRAYAGLGYAAFASTMTIGRFAGGMIVRRLGPTNIIVYGGLSAAAGFAIATFGAAWEAGLVGYALVGAGCANIAPVLFTAVGRQTLMPEHLAVPAISTIGYAGILAGPAMIGLAAQGTSLPTAFLMVAALLIGVAGSGRFLRV